MNREDMATFIGLHEQSKRGGIIINHDICFINDHTYEYAILADIEHMEYVIKAGCVDNNVMIKAVHKCEDYEDMVNIIDQIIEDAELIIEKIEERDYGKRVVNNERH